MTVTLRRGALPPPWRGAGARRRGAHGARPPASARASPAKPARPRAAGAPARAEQPAGVAQRAVEARRSAIAAEKRTRR
jgi:hypothetical protein